MVDNDSTHVPPDTPLRKCTKCQKSLPATLEYFYLDKRFGILHARCKECAKIYDAQWRQDNPKGRREAQRRWSVSHPEKQAGYTAKYRAKNKEKVAISQSVSRKNHRPDPVKIGVIHARRKARKRKLPANFSYEDYVFMMQYWGYSCAYCGNQQGFLWKLASDHFIPLISDECPGTVAENMLPACHSVFPNARGCNSLKQRKDPHKWIIERFGPHMAKSIEKAIAAYFAKVIENHLSQSLLTKVER